MLRSAPASLQANENTQDEVRLYEQPRFTVKLGFTILHCAQEEGSWNLSLLVSLLLTSAAGSAIVELGQHLQKKTQKIGSGYTVTLDENDQIFRSWYSRNITPQHHTISQNVRAVNGAVNQRSFRIEDFIQ